MAVPELLPPPRRVPDAWLRELPWYRWHVVMLVWCLAGALLHLVVLPFQLLAAPASPNWPIAVVPAFISLAVITLFFSLARRMWRTVQQRNELFRRGAVCAGKLETLEPAGTWCRPEFRRVVYRYTLPSGTSFIGDSLTRSTETLSLARGMTVSVLYLPDRPSVSCFIDQGRLLVLST